jgi:hypothetical protein
MWANWTLSGEAFGMTDKPVGEMTFEEAMAALEAWSRSWNAARWRWSSRSRCTNAARR